MFGLQSEDRQGGKSGAGVGGVLMAHKMNFKRKLGKGEEDDWAWDLMSMSHEERMKIMSEQIERDYSPSDVKKIKGAFVKLAKSD
jgi:hypothetical protein